MFSMFSQCLFQRCGVSGCWPTFFVVSVEEEGREWRVLLGWTGWHWRCLPCKRSHATLVVKHSQHKNNTQTTQSLFAQIASGSRHFTPNRSARSNPVEKAAHSSHSELRTTRCIIRELQARNETAAVFSVPDARLRNHDRVPARGGTARSICSMMRQRQSTTQTTRVRQDCVRPHMEHVFASGSRLF